MKKLKLFIIHCQTGCTCCNYDDHTRGFYGTKEDAEKRVCYYLAKDSKFFPVASQYARQGVYHIEEVEGELIHDDKDVIVYDRVFKYNLIVVNDDGTIKNDCEEYLGGDI